MKKISLAFVLGMFVLMAQSELSFANPGDHPTSGQHHPCPNCSASTTRSSAKDAPEATPSGVPTSKSVSVGHTAK